MSVADDMASLARNKKRDSVYAGITNAAQAGLYATYVDDLHKELIDELRRDGFDIKNEEYDSDDYIGRHWVIRWEQL